MIDILSYFWHKLFHGTTFYSIHKIHHEYEETFSIVSHYVHPLEFMMSFGFAQTGLNDYLFVSL